MAPTFLQTASDISNATTYTFTAQNFGAAAADRYIIVAYGCRIAGGGRSISSITVGGVAATVVKDQITSVTNSDYSAICIAAVPTGTSGDVVVTMTGSGAVRAAIALWAVTGLLSATPSMTASSSANAPTANLDIPANGFAIACAFDGSNGVTCTWTGLTEQYDFNIPTEGNGCFTGASDSFVSAQTGLTITATFTAATECTGCFASWGFAAAGNPWYAYAQMGED